MGQRAGWAGPGLRPLQSRAKSGPGSGEEVLDPLQIENKQELNGTGRHRQNGLGGFSPCKDKI